MKTTYIYSASRVKALEKELLSESDVNRLLDVSAGEEMVKAIKETYLFDHLSGETTQDIFVALDRSVEEAKKMISNTAPEAHFFDFLWIRYDLHNLRVYLRAKKADLKPEKIAGSLSYLGKYDPKVLLKYLETGTLNRLEPELAEIFDEANKAVEENGLAESDMAIDKGYFRLAKRMVGITKDKNLTDILQLLIDLHNIKTRLRTLSVERVSSQVWFVEGGSLSLSEIESKEQLFAVMARYGGEARWRDAIDLYNTDGHLTLFEIKTNEYFLERVRVLGQDIFSPASLLSYFFQCQNSAKVIQALVVGKESGQDKNIIRNQLHSVYA